MRALWRGLVRIVFWSFERGTLPYDVAVAVIVLFVLFSPRSWFNDRPTPEIVTATAVGPATVELLDADPSDGAIIYRVDARLVSQDGPDLAKQLREAVRKSVRQSPQNGPFEILRFDPIRGRDGAVVSYNVYVLFKP
jgi:hypothetical protein